MQQPSIGRVVLVSSPNNEMLGSDVTEAAALVTRVNVDGTVNLVVFRNMAPPIGVENVPHGGELLPFGWRWPPREPSFNAIQSVGLAGVNPWPVTDLDGLLGLIRSPLLEIQPDAPHPAPVEEAAEAEHTAEAVDPLA